MAQETDPSLQIQQMTGLKPRHFADLIRVAQLVFDPASGVSGRVVNVAWHQFGLAPSVVTNLQALGRRYRYAMPDQSIVQIWNELLPETRNWLIENKNDLWQFEEFFPAFDED